jgi:hypothetical protein
MSILSKLKRRKHQQKNQVSLKSPEEIDALADKAKAIWERIQAWTPEQRQAHELRLAEARKTDPIFGGMPRVRKDVFKGMPTSAL